MLSFRDWLINRTCKYMYVIYTAVLLKSGLKFSCFRNAWLRLWSSALTASSSPAFTGICLCYWHRKVTLKCGWCLLFFFKIDGFEVPGCHLKRLIFSPFSFLKTEYEILQELYNFKKPHKDATEVRHFLVGYIMWEWFFWFMQ